MLLMHLVPEDELKQVLFRVKGTTERVAGPYDFDGEVFITIDRSAVGHLIFAAMSSRGRKAKKGPVTVTFRGAAGYRAKAQPPSTPKED